MRTFLRLGNDWKNAYGWHLFIIEIRIAVIVLIYVINFKMCYYDLILFIWMKYVEKN